MQIMENIIQTLTGFPIPTGFRLKFEYHDCGITGSGLITVLYSIGNKIHQMVRTTDFDGDDGASYRLFFDLYDVNILHIHVSASQFISKDRNHFIECQIVKQQGRGGQQSLNRLFHVPLRGSNIATWPVPNQQHDPYENGVPFLFSTLTPDLPFVFDIPLNYTLKILSYRLHFTTDANVADRLFVVDYSRSGVPFSQDVYFHNITANSTAIINCGKYFDTVDDQIGNFRTMKIRNYLLTDIDSINFDLGNKQVGDLLLGIHIWGFLNFNIT